MNSHPQAAAIAAAVADRDRVRLAPAVTDTVRLRALLPAGPIEEHGRDAAGHPRLHVHFRAVR
jgi:hypothetical protein